MNTPIYDFVKSYSEKNVLRLHMPGHKGVELVGDEKLDITEIKGADSLFECDGIIKESEQNASTLFGSHTYYSTEGSSLCIRAMIYLSLLYAKENGKKPIILATRNVHKTFLSAVALLDINVEWIYSNVNYLSCDVSAETLEKYIDQYHPTAVYVTSPDYLGNILVISELSKVCKNRGVLLLVDNAHGAYLKFLPKSLHPCDLGADICCDSAHKTLPALTGGAYLHISRDAPSLFVEQAKNALALFASTSPSYLILSSLDCINRYLSDEYTEELADFIVLVDSLKSKLAEYGYTLVGDEKLKLTISTKPFGYYGFEIAELLRKSSIECEFCDKDHVVMMLTPQLGAVGLERLINALTSLKKCEPLNETPPLFSVPKRALSIREAALSPSEIIPSSVSLGRALALTTVACPPAVPILVCGEQIDENALRCFEYYGIDTCCVVK